MFVNHEAAMFTQEAGCDHIWRWRYGPGLIGNESASWKFGVGSELENEEDWMIAEPEPLPKKALPKKALPKKELPPPPPTPNGPAAAAPKEESLSWFGRMKKKVGFYAGSSTKHEGGVGTDFVSRPTSFFSESETRKGLSGDKKTAFGEEDGGGGTTDAAAEDAPAAGDAASKTEKTPPSSNKDPFAYNVSYEKPKILSASDRCCQTSPSSPPYYTAGVQVFTVS